MAKPIDKNTLKTQPNGDFPTADRLSAKSEGTSLARNAGSMGVAVLLSRLLGVIREQVLAYFFGAGMAADAYLTAFRIPNLLRDLLAEGALSTAFVTEFSRTSPEAKAKKLAEHVFVVMTIVLLVVCSLIYVLSPQIVQMMASDFGREPGKLELTTQLTQLLAFFLYFVSFAALSMGILNSLGHFFIPSLGPAAFNLFNILLGGGLAWYLKDQGQVKAILGFTVGTLVGGVFQWGVSWPLLIKRGFAPWLGVMNLFRPAKIKEAFLDPGVRTVGKLMTPSILSVAAVQINIFVDTSFAAGLGSGAVSWLSFSYRIMYFPLGIFGVALSTAALPRLSKMVKEKNFAAFQDTLDQGMSWTVILAIGSTLGLVVFRDPIVSLLYEHGKFLRHDTIMTGYALAAFSAGLIAFNANKIMVQAFYALNKVWIPASCSFVAIVMNYVGDWYLSKIWGHAGVALSTSITSFLNTLIYLVVLARMGHGVVHQKFLRALVASTLGGLGIAAFAWFRVPERLMEGRSDPSFMPKLFLTMGLAGLVYVFFVIAISPEGRALVKKFSARFGRAK